MQRTWLGNFKNGLRGLRFQFRYQLVLAIGERLHEIKYNETDLFCPRPD